MLPAVFWTTHRLNETKHKPACKAQVHQNFWYWKTSLVSCCVLHHAFHRQMSPNLTFWFDGVSHSAWAAISCALLVCLVFCVCVCGYCRVFVFRYFNPVQSMVSQTIHSGHAKLQCYTKCDCNASWRLKAGAHDDCCPPSAMLTFQSISQGWQQTSRASFLSLAYCSFVFSRRVFMMIVAIPVKCSPFRAFRRHGKGHHEQLSWAYAVLQPCVVQNKFATTACTDGMMPIFPSCMLSNRLQSCMLS